MFPANRFYTKEQQAHRDAILKPKPRKEKDKYISDVPVDFIEQRVYYLNNCIWWLNYFKDGHCDKDRVIAVVNSIENMAKELREHVNKLP